MEEHEHSLSADLDKILRIPAGRRESLRWLMAGAATTLPLIGCGGSSQGGAAAASSATITTTTPASGAGSGVSAGCTVIPEETGGPYPADGTNGGAGGIVNVLTQSGVVRSDIRGSFNGSTGVAAGVPLTIRLKIVNANNGCASAAGFAVYLWHCDRDGNYSLYSGGITNQNYLRGVQEADANGELTFVTIFPGCYAGRMPHVHFEVYPTLARSANAGNRIRTSQFAFPDAPLKEVYASSGYSASARNLAQISYASDNVFSDGVTLQMSSVTGSVADGYVATLTVAVVA